LEEVLRYRDQLERFVAENLPSSDAEIVRQLLISLDRPAFRTPFYMESSLSQFRAAITEAIATINTGTTSYGKQLPSKSALKSPALRAELDSIVGQLVIVRATFDNFLKSGAIKPCGCGRADCPTFMLSAIAAEEMDRVRRKVLEQAKALDRGFPSEMYGAAPPHPR
jgi:hypothetical protein